MKPALVLLAVLASSLQLPSLGELESSRHAYLAGLAAYGDCRDDEGLRIVRGVNMFHVKVILESRLPLVPDDAPQGPAEAPRVHGSWRPSPRALGAAVLLHARLDREGLPVVREEHGRLAAHLTEMLLESNVSDETAGVAYGLLAIDLQDQGRLGRLAQVLSRMTPARRRQLPALLAAASLHELLSTPMVSPRSMAMATEPEPPRLSPRPRTPDGWGREMTAALERGKRANRSRAVALYREAAALAPWDAESPVRLALLLLEDGHLLEAEAALATAAPLDKPLTLRYMEALARARLAERRGRLDDAASAYERAAAMMPLAQTPLLAAARLLFVRGRSAEARALLARLTSTAGAGDDPRWQFVLGQTWRRGEYLQQLDGMVRRCGR